MKTRRHHVWKSEDEIIRAIDSSRRRMNKCLSDIERLELVIRVLQEFTNDPIPEPVRAWMAAAIKYRRTMVEELQKSMARAKGRLPGLKNALAAIRTKTFDFMGDHKDVVSE